MPRPFGPVTLAVMEVLQERPDLTAPEIREAVAAKGVPVPDSIKHTLKILKAGGLIVEVGISRRHARPLPLYRYSPTVA